MPALQFLPWCRLDKDYEVGEITLKRFERDNPLDGADPLTTARIRQVLSSYKSMSGFPVRHAVVVAYREHELLDELSDEEYEKSTELIQVAAFAGLAHRQYFTQIANYCNNDHFRSYRQTFREEPTRTALVSRRPDGHSMNSVAVAELVISKPPHADSQETKLDEGLLEAIIAHRDSAESSEWARWQNAISCFDAANSDDGAALFQIEWVLLASAFEHVLGARSDARDVARLLVEKLSCDHEVMAVEARRNTNNWTDDGHSLRYEWMREFYRIRGDFAHGRMDTMQPLCWKPQEHLLIARIAFPILIRCLLRDAGRYTLTQDDEAQLTAFERFVDGDFFSPANSPLSEETPLWRRLLEEGREAASGREIEERLEGLVQEAEKNK